MGAGELLGKKRAEQERTGCYYEANEARGTCLPCSPLVGTQALIAAGGGLNPG